MVRRRGAPTKRSRQAAPITEPDDLSADSERLAQLSVFLESTTYVSSRTMTIRTRILY